MPAVRVLSFHAAYRCRHAGACCTSNWPIPVEADRLLILRAAVAAGVLRPAAGEAQTAIDEPADAPKETPGLLARAHERCVFFDDSPVAEASGRCRIHAVLGHDALPLACRQFPRVSVWDPRGVSITLSHYCPTAAGLLDAPTTAPFTIIGDAPGFPADGEYIGLDARESWPPLLSPGLLMDWESWWECERLAVDLFAASTDAEHAMARLRGAIDHLETWRPADGPLVDRVRAGFASGIPRSRGPSTAALISAVFEAIPVELRPARLPNAPPPSDPALRRFLAAHAFANWTIHTGSGMRGWLGSIETAAALIDGGMGVRHADLLLRHLVA